MSFNWMNMRNVLCLLLVAVLMIGILTVFIGCSEQTQSRLRVATTTSLYDTGLWGYLEPMFEEEYNVELDVVASLQRPK